MASTHPSMPGDSVVNTLPSPSSSAALEEVVPMQATAGHFSLPASCTQALRGGKLLCSNIFRLVMDPMTFRTPAYAHRALGHNASKYAASANAYNGMHARL